MLAATQGGPPGDILTRAMALQEYERSQQTGDQEPPGHYDCLSAARWRVTAITSPSAEQLQILSRRRAAAPGLAHNGVSQDWWNSPGHLSRHELLERYGLTEQRLAALCTAPRQRKARGERHPLSESDGSSHDWGDGCCVSHERDVSGKVVRSKLSR